MNNGKPSLTDLVLRLIFFVSKEMTSTLAYEEFVTAMNLSARAIGGSLVDSSFRLGTKITIDLTGIDRAQVQELVKATDHPIMKEARLEVQLLAAKSRKQRRDLPSSLRRHTMPSGSPTPVSSLTLHEQITGLSILHQLGPS
jgi:hypothetical protein